MSAAAPLVPFDRAETAQAPVRPAASQLAAILENILAFAEASARRTGPGGYVPEELLTFEQVAQVLTCSERKAREWVESYCSVVMVGVLPRVRRADLDAAIRRLARPYGDRA